MKGAAVTSWVEEKFKFSYAIKESMKPKMMSTLLLQSSQASNYPSCITNIVANFTKEIKRNIQLQLELPFLSTVDAIGSKLNNIDHIHLTTPSQVKLGKKMAMTFLNMINYT
nr:probable carbohydrate esterase At4g34215 [Ipomoea batatas]